MLTDFTFRDTGITVKIKKISPMLAADITEAMPAPQPPLNEVDYGEPKGKVLERNYSDPSYMDALIKHQLKINEVWRRVMILRGVVVEGDDWRKEVEEYRKFIAKQTGAHMTEPEDLVVYVLRICVGSDEDLAEMITAITRRSQPTQESVESAKQSFRGEIQGP
jgi:hypothetical protein